MKYKLVFLVGIMLLQGCASGSSMSCNQTKIITPLAVAVQKHIGVITGQDVVVYPSC